VYKDFHTQYSIKQTGKHKIELSGSLNIFQHDISDEIPTVPAAHGKFYEIS
jgi:hypothetical protein